MVNDAWYNRLGPVLRVLGFAVAVFAVLWAITPYLTAAQSVQPTYTESPPATAPPMISKPVTPATTTTIGRVATGEARRFDDLDAWDRRSEEYTRQAGWPDSLAFLKNLARNSSSPLPDPRSMS